VSEQDSPEPTPVVRDKRRIDPVTGEVRKVAGTPATSPPPSTPVAEDPLSETPATDVTALQQQLTERTADVQRIQAEYANYRKRVERDRDLVREQATASLLAEFLTVLDDIERAKEHGEVVGGFKAVADSLEAAVTKLGLERYGDVGDPFDPVIHEALTHTESPDVSETTCVEIFQPGYRFAGRVIRPARVAVADPAPV
jgi:molecular chaperone GrpE